MFHRVELYCFWSSTSEKQPERNKLNFNFILKEIKLLSLEFLIFNSIKNKGLHYGALFLVNDQHTYQP